MAAYEVYGIWKAIPTDVERRLLHSLDRGLERSPGNMAKVFFRADDVAVPGRMCQAMFHAFGSHGIPLCPALVPAWMSRERWRALTEMAGHASAAWGWHQHGWRHVNHEPQGRKYEFGPSRTRAAVRQDLKKGLDRLREVVGDSLIPVFTPPWNRMSVQAMETLVELGYAGLSRDVTAKPAAPDSLPDIQVNVDLHTTRQPDPEQGWAQLLESVEKAASTGVVGFMLHHQRMNEAAAQVLDRMVGLVKRHGRLQASSYSGFLA